MVGMVEDLYRFQHSATFISWRQFLKGLLQIDEKQRILEDAKEFEEPCKCLAGSRTTRITGGATLVSRKL